MLLLKICLPLTPAPIEHKKTAIKAVFLSQKAQPTKLSNTPAATAEPLTPATPTAAAAAVPYASTWAAMLQVDAGKAPAFDGLFFDDGMLAWAGHNGSKPGRRGLTWVLHADPEWSESNLDSSADTVGAALSDRFCAATDTSPTGVQLLSMHRWRYALAPAPLSVGAHWDHELGLGMCGDWCKGARIEDAFLSGQALAGRILGHLAHSV